VKGQQDASNSSRRGREGGGGAALARITNGVAAAAVALVRERDVAWGGRRRRNWRHKLRWGGSLGLRFEPDFSNVESRHRDTPVRPPTFSAFRTAKQQFFRG
jgi:hypothetical protein